MQRYLMLEVSEGGETSSLVTGEAGFVWAIGPLPEEMRKTPPSKIRQVKEFMGDVYKLNLRLWPEPRRNVEPLGVIICSVEGDLEGATTLDDMGEASKEFLSEVELYFRAPTGDIC